MIDRLANIKKNLNGNPLDTFGLEHSDILWLIDQVEQSILKDEEIQNPSEVDRLAYQGKLNTDNN